MIHKFEAAFASLMMVVLLHGMSPSAAAAITVAPTSVPGWTLGKAGYAQTLVGSGGTAPYAFLVDAGALPGGLTLSTTGALSGTPTAAGAFGFAVKVTDHAGVSVTQSYSLTINPAVVVAPASLPNWTLNIGGYLQTVTSSNGTGTRTLTLSTGTLPTGLTFVPSTGVLSGKPTAVGTSNFTITATDTLGATGSHAYTVVISPALVITATTLPAWTSGKAYSKTFTATGGTGTPSFSVTTGALPDGLVLATTGVLSGTPTVAGTFTFTVTAKDAAGATSALACSVVINPAVTLAPTSLPNWTLGKTGYTQTIISAGGTGARTLSVSTGTIPTGMTFTAATGILAGTPTTAGTFNFTLTATDAVGATAVQAFTVIISPTVVVTSASVPNWTVNTPGYLQTIANTGGTGAVTFAVTTGTLPAGLSLAGTGVLSGTPTTVGTSNFTVTATDTLGATGTHAYTIIINPALAITTATLPVWTVNKAFSKLITTTGGTGTPAFAVTAGTLPGGLALAAGVLSGTPTVAGSFFFTITATDAAAATSSQAYSILINPVVTISPGSMPNWTLGRSGYFKTVTSAGGTGARTLSLSGTIPTGMTFTIATGVLTGTPTTAGTFDFTITVTDAVGASAAQAYEVIINPVVAITTATLPNWTANKAYSTTIASTGGTGAVGFVVTAGTLPAGLTLTSAGLLSGTPTAVGTSTFTITASDSLGSSAAHAYTVVINPVVVVAAANLPAWTVNKSGYSQTIVSTNGTGAKTLSVSSGAIPTGMTFTAGGVLSGTPSAAGTFNFVVTATDTVGATGAQSYTVTVNPALLVVSAPLPAWTLFIAGYSRVISASGGTGTLALSVASGALPGGLALTTGGLLSGEPNAAGTFNFTIKATDTVGATASQSFTIVINSTVSLATDKLPGWSVSVPGYNKTLAIAGGTGAATFAVTSGALPPGLTLTSAGLLSGTPSVLGTFGVTITATDSLGSSGTQAYFLTISPPVTIATLAVSDWTLNKSGYLQPIAAAGGTGAASFTVTTGALPGGLTLTSAGSLNGTPTTAGTFNFTIMATDAAGSTGIRAYTITINPAVIVTAPVLPPWTAQLGGYLQTVTSANGTGAKRITVSLGSVPTGMTLSSAGVLSGTPTVAGKYNFTIAATDAVGAVGTLPCTLVINPVVTIDPGTLPGLTWNLVGYSQIVSDIGGTGVSTLAVTAGSLPTGLTLTPKGFLSGIPTVMGTFNFEITATDSLGATGRQTYTVIVAPGAPTVVAPTSLDIGGSGATVGGNVITDGGDPVSVVGVVLAPTAINTNPQVDGTGVINAITSATTGVFTLRATGLSPGTAYTYAAYATNSEGTSYSSVGSFTTLSNNSALASLLLNEGTLSPAFDSGTKSYTATVPNSATSLTLIATTAHPLATVQINDSSATAGNSQATLPLGAGLTNVAVKVTAPDGTTVSTYTIAVTRLAAFIAVRQAATALVNGVSVTDFGRSGVGKTVARVFTVTNISPTALANFTFTFSGMGRYEFSVTTPPVTRLAIGASTTFTVTFNPGDLGTRAATMLIDADGETLNAFATDLTGVVLELPKITSPPASQLLAAGQAAGFAVTAAGEALTYKWLKISTPIAGATNSTLSLGSATQLGAGVYTAAVTNPAGTTTSLANLGVVDTSPATVTVINGKILALNASAAGPNLTYQWQKNGVAMADGSDPNDSFRYISGTTTPKLNVSKAVPADADVYTCLVTMPDLGNPGMSLTLSTGMFTVKVTSKPVINDFAPGPWITSGNITDVVTALNIPTGFTVTGQPSGVTIDASGHFLGRPKLGITSPTLYHLVIIASNAAGASAPLNVDVTVNPLPVAAVGTFNGLVDRDPVLTSGFGGSINVVTTAMGTLSGKLNLGAGHYSFTGQLDATAGGTTTTALVTVVRTTTLSNLTLALTFHHNCVGDVAHVGEMDGTIIDASALPPVPVNCLAWRSTTATPFAAVYTAALELDPALAGTTANAGNIVYPQGNGYGTLTIATTGTAIWKGKMADGTPTYASVTVGPHGEVPLHFMLYKSTGSAHGWVQASGTDPNLLLDSMGPFDWMKNPQAVTTLSYKDGFPLHQLTVVGAKYLKPTAASPLVLGIPVVTSGTNAQLLFAEGGLSALTSVASPVVSIAAAANGADLIGHAAFRLTGTAATNSVVLPVPNPAGFALSVSPTTGLFSGSFILHGDQDPTKSTASLVNRTATFSGVCITRGTGTPALTVGVGCFLLPELQPYPGLAVAAAPLLSGQVLLQQIP